MREGALRRLRMLRARISFDAYWGRLGCDSYHVWRLLHARKRKWSIALNLMEEGLKK